VFILYASYFFVSAAASTIDHCGRSTASYGVWRSLGGRFMMLLPSFYITDVRSQREYIFYTLHSYAVRALV